MTTGRINQVAFLGDVDARMSPIEPEGDDGVKTGTTVVRVKGQMRSSGWRRPRPPRPRTTFRIRENGQRRRAPRQPTQLGEACQETRSLPGVHPAPIEGVGRKGAIERSNSFS